MGNTTIYKGDTVSKAGYEYLLAYKITVPIYDYTVEFCRRADPFSPKSPQSPVFPKLSSNRTHDQMIQASRSGMQNLPEGFKQQSLASYITLAGVSRGSLEELLNDCLSYARQNKLEIWDKDRAKSLLITLISQANYLIDKLILSLKEKHTKEGGFRENLLKKRLEYKKQ